MAGPLSRSRPNRDRKSPGFSKESTSVRVPRGSGGFCPGPCEQQLVETTHADRTVLVSFVCRPGTVRFRSWSEGSFRTPRAVSQVRRGPRQVSLGFTEGNQQHAGEILAQGVGGRFGLLRSPGCLWVPVTSCVCQAVQQGPVSETHSPTRTVIPGQGAEEVRVFGTPEPPFRGACFSATLKTVAMVTGPAFEFSGD